MIEKEDIKVGLRFYITKNDCLKCNFDPIGIHDGRTPILFNAERKDADVYICTSVSTDYKYIARFREEDIMMFGTKFDIVTKGEGEAANKKTEQVSHPSHYAWLKDLCGVEPIEICQHFDFSVGNALKYIMRKGKVERNLTEKQQRIQDLEKAIYYLKNEIDLMKNDSNNKDNK
jgi:hypothetical protein|nr:MAG TPA: nucelotide kinase [Caudoviricetes sp.]